MSFIFMPGNIIVDDDLYFRQARPQLAPRSRRQCFSTTRRSNNDTDDLETELGTGLPSIPLLNFVAPHQHDFRPLPPRASFSILHTISGA